MAKHAKSFSLLESFGPRKGAPGGFRISMLRILGLGISFSISNIGRDLPHPWASSEVTKGGKVRGVGLGVGVTGS